MPRRYSTRPYAAIAVSAMIVFCQAPVGASAGGVISTGLSAGGQSTLVSYSVKGSEQ